MAAPVAAKRAPASSAHSTKRSATSASVTPTSVAMSYDSLTIPRLPQDEALHTGLGAGNDLVVVALTTTVALPISATDTDIKQSTPARSVRSAPLPAAAVALLASLGGAVAIGLLIALFCCWARRRRRSKREDVRGPFRRSIDKTPNLWDDEKVTSSWGTILPRERSDDLGEAHGRAQAALAPRQLPAATVAGMKTRVAHTSPVPLQSVRHPEATSRPLGPLITALDQEIKSPTTPRNTVCFGTALGSPQTDEGHFSPQDAGWPESPRRARYRRSSGLPYLPAIEELSTARPVLSSMSLFSYYAPPA